MTTRKRSRALDFGVCLSLAASAGCSGSGSHATGSSSGGGGGPPVACSPSQAGCLSFSHTYSTQTIAPGEEIASLCQSYSLHNPAEIWVNAVELDNDGAYHHSNWFFVPNTDFTMADGTWDCTAGGFDETLAAIAGGVLYAQSTQAKHEVQQFPPGVAVRIPPWSRIVASTHLLNVTSAPVTTTLRMTVTAIPKADVTTKLTPFQLVYHDLHIPPQASADFSSSCDFASAAVMAGAVFAPKLYYVLPHYHKLGTSFEINYYGGPNDGAAIDSIAGFTGDARGKTFNPPLDLSANKGVTFGCGYTNPTASEVGWGIGNQEMCEMLGFADSPIAYIGAVSDGTGMVTGMQGSTVMNSGPCSVTALPWSQEKAGGVPP